MRIVTAAEVEGALDWDALIESLRQAFRQGAEVPVRHHHNIENPGEPDGTLLLMPAWQPGRHVGVKLATVFPGNSAQGLPAVMGAYLLLDGKTGAPQALIDGPVLTLKRTAAASALAAGYPGAAGLRAPADGRHRRLGTAPDHGACRGPPGLQRADLGPLTG